MEEDRINGTMEGKNKELEEENEAKCEWWGKRRM